MSHLKAHKQTFIDLQDRLSQVLEQLEITVTTAARIGEDTVLQIQEALRDAENTLDDANEKYNACVDDCRGKYETVLKAQKRVDELIDCLRNFERELDIYYDIAKIAWELINRELPHCQHELRIREEIVDRLWTYLGHIQHTTHSSNISS